jgi:hypothetical protein
LLGATPVTYRCATCGETHDGLPDIGYRYPDTYFGIPESERERRVRVTTDICAIDDEDFFVRGVLLIPIKDQSDRLGLGVWVSQKRENFQTYIENFDTAEIGPFFGWLSNSIPFYEKDTWALKTMAHFQGNNQRPLIKLAPCEHPLYLDYSEGITLDRAWSFVHHKVEASDT